MEALALPSREIRKRFTKSDVVLMGWRSGEIAANMDHSASDQVRIPPPSGVGRVEELSRMPVRDHAGDDDTLRGIEERLGGVIIERMVNERGEVDLRRLTGAQAAQYFQALGIPLITM